MSKFRMWLVRFMDGRYGTCGVDSLNKFLFGAYFVLILLNLLSSRILGGSFLLLTLLYWAALIFLVFRTMSRNIPKRQAENARFTEIWTKVKRFFKRQINRVKDIKTHRYRKCTHCKAVLRLPRKKGTMSVTCPRCHESFDVKILI